ncbi:AAA family ATPase [Pseudoxanthomonas indica]|uniref:Replicative DNA helicase n=1 Tax=Pseudoxanthomonas indica TaxID=428993 RepID=A0A1T5K1G0_9GAMM|nr:AAA family ATPase [Pseudoxanthomonas indica]GGD45811.1 hypothetical protein GCM10007235_17230 [Pseudoxanthomonas indica]SKC57338.1 Replicative DNA helicase [Pseudoxanthomonas indica]
MNSIEPPGQGTAPNGRPTSRPYAEERLIPPHSVEAEQAILGGLLLSQDAWEDVGGLAETDFYRRDHRHIFRAISELAAHGKPFDAVTLGDWFSSQAGATQERVSLEYLIDLAANTPSAANVSAYAEIVLEKSRLRRLVDIGTDILNAALSPEGRESSVLLSEASALLDGARRTEQAPTGLRDVPLTAFMDSPPSTVGYAVHPVVPRGVVTLWGGHGGAGKSISTLQLLAHGACGQPWQGLTPDGAIRSIYLSLEDPGDLVRYRLRRVCESYGLDERRVETGVRVFDCPDGRAALMSEVSSFGIRSMVETQLLAQVRELCEGADLIVVDNASDAYGGNENDRQSVRTFMTALSRIAREHNAGLVLLAHIDKSAARNGANGNTYSGSTAWHNSARSRMAIVAGKDPGTVELHHEKNNLGKCADPVHLKWNTHGVLVPLTPMDRAERDQANDDGALALAVLNAAAERSLWVNTATTGAHPGHKAVQHLAEYESAFGQDKWRGARRFHAALDALHQAGRISKQPMRTKHRGQVEVWLTASPSAAVNGAVNAAVNADDTGNAPPYRASEGGSYMGGGERSTARSTPRSTQGGGEEA